MGTEMMRARGPMNYLTVAERVAVIQEYDLKPNVPFLARKYHCGKRQIQNIIRRREEYLEEWKKNPDPQSLPRRQPSRIKAVNTLLHEWCRRALIYGYDLTDELFKEVSKKIAETINIVEFLPEKRWMGRFKRRFNVTEMTVDIDSYVSENRPSLDIEDLVRDFEPEIKKLLERKPPTKKVPCQVNSECNDTDQSPQSPQSQCQSSGEPVECIDILSDSEQSQDLNANDDCMEQLYPRVEMTELEPVKPLSNYKEAVNHLGPLEQFVLSKENLRAIGLINQIENILREEMDKET